MRRENAPVLKQRFEEQGLVWGAPIFLRFHKYADQQLKKLVQTRAGVPSFLNHNYLTGAFLEVWVQKDNVTGEHVLFDEYPVCVFSGKLGPKYKEGDGQTVEGFYNLTASQFNPYSNYRLSVNIGYPNAYDRFRRYTGGAIMIHGHCASIGCLAMNDKIDEVYTILENAIISGQREIPYQAFPFRMTPENLQLTATVLPQLQAFWAEIQPGWKAFEETHVPPYVAVVNGNYVIRARGTPLTAAQPEAQLQTSESTTSQTEPAQG